MISSKTNERQKVIAKQTTKNKLQPNINMKEDCLGDSFNRLCPATRGFIFSDNNISNMSYITDNISIIDVLVVMFFEIL